MTESESFQDRPFATSEALSLSDAGPEPITGQLRFDSVELCRYLTELWPDSSMPFRADFIEHLDATSIRLRRPAASLELRPGGTVGGPSLMRLADGVAYMMILARLGDAALAVTSHLSIEFLRRSRPGDLVAEAELLKVGRSLATVDVKIREADGGHGGPIAAALVTYSLALVTTTSRSGNGRGTRV
jgi:uncharacterized protein (TIGR00369 family)